MIDIDLAATPNQSLTIQLEESEYVIQIAETNGCMSATISRDDVAIVSGMRIVGAAPILPYRYEESGNFVIVTEGGALPYYDQFGITQFLVYLDDAELAAYREG